MIPEDVPNPSVVAPEAPAYETLESFRSGETTFLYRYRLTATSRATGLSSWREVEVYVSGSRPSVYCPLEVAVEEGSAVSLDCEGVDPLSHRMDYDEDGASILWEWEGLWGASTSLLDATDMSSALFTAPAGSAGEEYHYIASMTSQASGMPRTARRRVTVRVVGGEAVGDTVADIAATNGASWNVDCTHDTVDNEYHFLTVWSGTIYHVDEGDPDFTIQCRLTAEPGGAYTWSWTAAGGTANTSRLSAVDISSPVFDVPENVNGDTEYRYWLIASVVTCPCGDPPYEDRDLIRVHVRDTGPPPPSLACTHPDPVYEGTADITLDCSVTNEPTGAAYSWAVRGSTSNTNDLSSTTILQPTFAPPGDIAESGGANKDYEYTVTLSAGGVKQASEEVTVTVLEKPNIYPPCGITGYSFISYEGEADFQLTYCPEYNYTGAPGLSPVYRYNWTTRGSTSSTAISLLSATDVEEPFFRVPDAVSEDKRYEYTMTVSADNADPFLMSYAVNVKNKPPIVVTCEDPDSVYEGSADIELECEASGAPSGSSYTWSWSPTTRLTDHDTGTPTFAVPGSVEQDTTYTYTVRATVNRADAGTAEVTVTVKDTDAAAPSLTCADSEVYEGAADITLDCSVENEPSDAAYSWTGADVANRLTGTDRATPTFSVPGEVGGWDKDYDYTVTLSVAGIDTASTDITVRVLEKPDIQSCIGRRAYEKNEGAPDFSLVGCLDPLQGAPGDDPIYRYTWTNLGVTPTSALSLLSSTEVSTPVFQVPDDVPEDMVYEYSRIISADNADEFRSRYTVVIRDLDFDRFNLACSEVYYGVYAGWEDIELECSAPGAPEGAIWEWIPRETTSDTDRLSATNIPNPIFDVPRWDEIDTYTEDLLFYYTVSVSAGIQSNETNIVVRVKTAGGWTMSCSTEASFFEGDSDKTIANCSAVTANGDILPDSHFTWEWMTRGTTSDTDRLGATDIPNPSFDVPDSIDNHEIYEYTLKVTWGRGSGSYLISVTVLDRDAFDATLALVCADPPSVYEGSEDFDLDCSASGAPAGVAYSYKWQGSRLDLARLIAGADGPTPTFAVPRAINETRTYSYRLTVSGGNTIPASADVTVTVLNKGALALACADPGSVYEGSADIAFDCSVSGAPAGSAYEYAWTAIGSTTNTALLSAADIASPVFYVPEEVDATTTYEYLLTASAENAESGSAEVTVTVLNRGALAVVCADPGSVYEGSEDFAFDCSASGAPSGSDYAYEWTARGSTANTDRLISGTDGPAPTFYVPDALDATTTYEYLLTASAENAESGSAEVTVTVLNRGALAVVCADPGSVYEGSADIAFDCSASGAPAGSAYEYAWTAIGSTTNTALLSAADIASPVFYVPEEVDATTTYEYLLTASAENAESGSAEVTVTVLNRGALALACADPGSVYEGSADIAFDCSVSGAPAGSAYEYAWTAIGSTTNTALLSAADIASPVFYVPEEVDATTTYEYLLTASAENAESGSAKVTVTVLNRGALAVVCADPGSVYEGSEDFAFDCSASGAPSGSDYAYEWTARGSTANTDRLISGTDGPAPTFYVPDALDATTTYEYLLTASAENAESGSAEVTVTVLNRGALAVVCADPGSVYEGSADIAFDCSASGAPAGSAYEYAWTAIGSTTNTALLSAADIASPVFYVPEEVDATTTYEYLLTASAENAESGSAEVTVTVLNRGALALACADPGSVYEGSADIAFDCSVSGAPAGSAYEYAWTAIGSTTNTALLSAADIASPVFYVPEEVDATTTYEYLLTASAENAESGSAKVTVTVLNRGALAVVCADPGSVYEGSEDFAFDCSASGAPSGSDYAYEWTARGSTANTDRLISGTDGPAPTFYVPDALDATTTYEYLLTASAENAESGSAAVTVTVLNVGALRVVCADPPSVYEGSEDIAFDCAASGAPGGSAYEYEWTARNGTANTDLLIAGADGPAPTFDVPEEVDATTTYEYTLTVSAENADPASADVTVTVLNKGALALACADPGSVYEGSEDIAFDCAASGAPGGSAYEYEWTARGSTTNTDLLSGADIASPVFAVPEEVDATTTYEYTLTVSAANAEDASADVTVTVLNKGALALACADPGSVYEGSEDIAFDCAASGAPGGSAYEYEWTARGSTTNTDLLSGADIASPVFAVPEEVDATTMYEYLLTASAENAEDATAEVTVTVLNKGALALACADPGSVYEGSEDIAFDCAASGAPGGSEYTYAWTARGSTTNTDLLSGADIASPVFAVPEEVDATTMYEYLLTASAENAEDATAEVTVTVLNKGALALACADPGSVYEGSADIAFDCSASGAPGDNPQYTYAWTARGDTPDTALLSATNIASPTFHVPDEVEEDETYEYLLTVSAANAKDAAADVTVTVLDRIRTPAPDPVSPPAEEPPADPLPAVAESSSRAPSDPTALGVRVSASSLRFGVQSAQTRASLDPMTDQISTRVSGPYHAGRMTLSPGGGASFDENGEMSLSIELASPVVLRRKEGGIEAALIVLAPNWSFAESCEQLSSQAIGGLYTEATLSEADCRLLRFGGELDLTDAPSGRYAGAIDVVLRSGESEETHSVEVEVTVVPSQRVITIGPGGVRFSTSREVPAGLTEDQSLSIYPDVAFLTEGKPNGAFELSNPSLIPLEVSVSARFGYTEATENGREVVIESPDGSRLGDLSQVVDIHPGVLVLMPGEKGLVRYGVQEGALAAMEEQGYAAFFDVVSSPRQYVRTDRMPEEVTGERTARVTMRVPGVYVPGEGASQLRATLLSLSYGVSMSATFLLETQDRPFAGEVVAYDGQGRELGRRETLVYTRSRVRVPLARMPEEEVVFLRFAPWGSSRVPEPTSVEWNAPGRDIGDVGYKEKTPARDSVKAVVVADDH